MRPDAVSPALAQAVFTRDRREIAALMAVWKGNDDFTPDTLILYWGRVGRNHWNLTAVWPGVATQVVCPAIIIDERQWGSCWGRWRIEHVKTEARIGKRAEPDMDHLMALCQGHTEDGMRAGSIWATANRAAERDYIAHAQRRDSLTELTRLSEDLPGGYR